ncbi:MAG: molecular chaperone HtpG [Candidatus Marinimicrobia bacterium]|nr:molecular chaperone HtpG [Candidatus Neomarinimicrobiota bacterium]
MTKGKEEHAFRAELSQLLDLITHSLYKHPEVFLRELVSNASDALNRLRFRKLTDKNIIDPEADLEIRIETDEDKDTFSIEDTGIGMTKSQLIEDIGTVANSGTLKKLKEIRAQDKEIDADIIGRFGVGFYATFMVTDQVIIETRSAEPGAKAWRWISDGKSGYTIEESDREKRGTKISFKLDEDYEEFSNDARVKNVIKKYSNFVDFPIYINGNRENTIQALWRKKEKNISEEDLNEFYKFVTMDYQDPLGHLHLDLEGVVNFKALLFVPSQAPYDLFQDIQNKKGLHLYANRVFIQDDAGNELLPEYLRFISGVVDTKDLPLNISRETTQHSPAMSKIKNILAKKILGMLEDWAKNDPGKYEKFFKNFGPLFKTGINTDFSNKDRIMNLLRYESTHTDKGVYTSLQDYVERMDDEQDEIYYITGDNREVVEKNPNLEYFIDNGIEVLYFIHPVDALISSSLDEYEDKEFKSIEKADIDFDRTKKEKKSDQEELSGKPLESLIDVFKETLGNRVEDVKASKRLVSSPATLVVGKDGMDPQVERMMKMMNQQGNLNQKKILEINPSHPIIRNLNRLNIGNSTDETLRKTILQLYESTLLLDGNLDDPAEFVKRMNELMTKATE